MFSKFHFKVLSSQWYFFQDESIQNYICRCTARTISLDRSHKSNSQWFFRKAYRTLVVFCCEWPFRHPRWRWGRTPIIYLRPKEAVRALVTLFFLSDQVFPTDSLLIKIWWENKFSGRDIAFPLYILIWNPVSTKKWMLYVVKGRSVRRCFVNHSRPTDDVLYVCCKVLGNSIMEKACIEHCFPS